MNQTELNAQAYDHIVREWAAFRSGCRVNACIQAFCTLLPAGARILDIGCGTGYPIDDYLNQNGFSIVGIDISENMIREARKLELAHAAFETADFLRFHSAQPFDALIAFDSLWHIEEARQELIYPQAASLLKEDGYFLFTHGKKRGTVRGKMYAEEFVYSALDASDMKRLLRDNGFEIVSWQEDYEEKTTGSRDLLAMARKRAARER